MGFQSARHKGNAEPVPVILEALENDNTIMEVL